MFLTVVAAGLTAPVPVRPSSWFSYRDMPAYLVSRGSGLWQVPISINVGPDGVVRTCEVEATSGIADLDKLTCRIAMRRARFQAARLSGVPSYGVYRTFVRWVIAAAPFDTSKSSLADVEVTLERLPAGLSSPTLVRVMFAVDAQGSKSSCVLELAQGLERTASHPALGAIACAQIMSHYRAKAAQDATGKPVTSVQNALVRFVAPRAK